HRNPLNYEDHKIAKEKDVKSPLNKNEKEGIRVALKSLKNSSNISDYFLNEAIWLDGFITFGNSVQEDYEIAKEKNMKNHLQCVSSNALSTVRIFGITQGPETSI
ncbi:14071_t:CDS:2, partial [Rhizophagus irregularis]